MIGLQVSVEDDDELEGEGKAPVIPAPVVAAATPAVVEDPEEKNLVELFAPAGSVGEPDEPVEV